MLWPVLIGLAALAAVYGLVRLVARADGIRRRRDMAGEPKGSITGRVVRHTSKTVFTAAVATAVSFFVSWGIFLTTKPAADAGGVPAMGPPTPPVVVMLDAPRPAEAVEYTPTTGWVPLPEVIADNLNPVWTEQFADTPAGRAVLGDDDVFLWQSVRKVNNRGPPWYPNVNQEQVGCCVGCGWKHCADVCQAAQILTGKRAEWKPVAVEVIYGNSRVAVGGGRISGDGSVGAWAKKAAEVYGVAPMEVVGGVDLTTFSPARAREYGRSGVPAAVNDAAKSHPVKGSALVKSWGDVKRAIGQGYPVAVSSDQGFSMERDATGRARPQGRWAHCMAVIGVRAARDGRAEAGFVLNSWGDRAHTGPVWPADAPVAGFWVDADVIDRMVKQGDSFALSDLTGFPARRVPLDWFIRAPVRPEHWLAA